VRLVVAAVSDLVALIVRARDAVTTRQRVRCRHDAARGRVLLRARRVAVLGAVAELAVVADNVIDDGPALVGHDVADLRGAGVAILRADGGSARNTAARVRARRPDGYTILCAVAEHAVVAVLGTAAGVVGARSALSTD